MGIYGFTFSTIELSVFGVLALAFFHQLYFYSRYMNGILKLRARLKNDTVNHQDAKPPVSVIICSKDESENLQKFLPFILQQDYPRFEVIVINDGSTDQTETLLRDLSQEYPYLRTTFVPVGANNVSTRKLGLTLGIKAAKYDYLLFTDADCMPENNQWIASMMRNFTRNTDFVLGYNGKLNQKGFLNELITYDTLFNSMQFLGMAIEQKPYVGTVRNMAYRKALFFEQKGFASTLQLASGDNDLMVNRAANAQNTRVEIATDGVTWSEPNITLNGWLYQKACQLSVESHFNGSSKFRLAIEPMTRTLFYLGFIAALIVGNMITAIAAGVFFITRLTTQQVIINKTSRCFGERKYIFTLLLFDIYLPLVNLYLKFFGGSFRRKKMLWK